MVELTEDQRDCLQELSNVAMGQAGSNLAVFLETFVNLSVPRVKLIDSTEIIDEVTHLVGEKDSAEQRKNLLVSAVRQGFHSAAGQVRGEAIVVFSHASFQEIADLMHYDDEVTETAEEELLLDITNILNGSLLGGFAEQLGYDLNYSAPSVIGKMLPLDEVFAPQNLIWTQSLLIEINYALEDNSFNCNLLLLMPGASIEVIRAAVDEILEDL
jgi:chemotaxis protein CheC